MSTQERIEGRKFAEEMIDLLPTDRSPFVLAAALRLRIFTDEVLGLAKPETGLLTMNDQQAEAFEREKITFGAHIGKAYRYVPLDYLAWLSDSNLRLAAYLRSDRGRKREVE